MRRPQGGYRPRPSGPSRPNRGQASAAPVTTLTPADTRPKHPPRTVTIPARVTVGELATILGVSVVEVIQTLIGKGVMATVNQTVDYETAAKVAIELGFTVQSPEPPAAAEKAEEPVVKRPTYEEEAANLVDRPPVVTVMGHVDHGKTSLLDAIRLTRQTEKEVGGITQHIGAYQVEKQGRKITFLDTPGHEAFTQMRARGAQVTDIAIIVVAADDGVMPQTVEAINHARAAGVPLIIAINKIDIPGVNPDRIKQRLADIGVLVEDWGGDVVSVPVSARQKVGIDELLEMILLVADLQNLRADPKRPAIGNVIEAEVDKSRGPVATVLVRTGTLKRGDNVVVGTVAGRVRAMQDDQGKPINRALPSSPVVVQGLSKLPQVGDTLEVVESVQAANELVAQRVAAQQQGEGAPTQGPAPEDAISENKGLNIVLKADVQGSLQPIVQSLAKVGNEEVQAHVIHQGTGTITESDVMLATASKAMIIGFGVRPDPTARRLADANGVRIEYYDIIYRLIEDVEAALMGLRKPVYQEVIDGHASVRAIFNLSKIRVAVGAYVTDGKVQRGDRVRVKHEGEVVHEGPIASLRRFKDDVREVASGYECGISLDNFNDLKEGDVLEFFREERVS